MTITFRCRWASAQAPAAQEARAVPGPLPVRAAQPGRAESGGGRQRDGTVRRRVLLSLPSKLFFFSW